MEQVGALIPGLDVSTIRPPLCLSGVSCSFTSIPNLDGCCINDPSGHFLQTQFWDTSPPLGGRETWTVHGLWPDYCDGGFEANCNSSRSHSAEQITQILSNASSPEVQGGTHPGLLQYMSEHWLSLDSRNSNLWAHEWNKHGTCISTLRPECYDRDKQRPDPPPELQDGDVLDYFTHAVLLYTSLPTFEFFSRHGIVPSYEQTYELEHLRQAIRDSPHGAEATIRCRNHDELSEIWYSFNVRADLRGAMDAWWDGNKMWNTWIPANPSGQVSNCPETGIRYLPKDDGKHRPPPPPTITSGTHTQTHTAAPTYKPSPRPFTGKGRLMVKVVEDRREMSKQGAQKVLQGATLHATEDRVHGFDAIPAQYTGCLIRKGNWYLSRSLSSCAIFTADDDAKGQQDKQEALTDSDANYHLFTLASRYAPCSFTESGNQLGRRADAEADADADADTVGTMYLSCSPNLPFQTIFSNDANVAHQHTEAAKRLTLGSQHKSRFFAESIPHAGEQLQLWTDQGWGSRKVEVEIYWEAIN